MRKALFVSTIILGLSAGMAVAKPASSLRDLVGARGSSGEMELTNRGFVAGKSTTAQGGRVVFWGNASDGTCVKVLTKNGRYASIVDAPPASCGLRKPAGGAKKPIGDLMNKTGVAVFDIMRSRGFAGVDTFNSGNDLISIYWNRATRQCVQVITSNNRVVAATDIGTHPKCR